MARLAFGGAEGQSTLLDVLTIGGTVNINTTTPRSGAACFSHPSGSDSRCIYAHTNVTNRQFYGRAWVYFSGNPSVSTRIASWSSGTTHVEEVLLGTDRKITAPDGTVSASAYSAGYHCIEIALKYDGTNWISDCKIDGVTLGSQRTHSPGVSPNRFNFGNCNSAAHGITLLSDDWAVNDDQGSSQNSWCGNTGSVLLSLPTADNAVGSDWKLGAGTAPSSNAYDSVNNVPPIGVSNATATDAKQIKDAVGSQTAPASNADFTCQSYTTAGASAGSTVTVTQALTAVAPSSGTGIAFAVKIVSNPADSAEATLTTPSTGAGTFPTGWNRLPGNITSAPSVTNGTQPVVRVGKRNTSTSPVSLSCFAGIYFEYEPAVNTDSGSGGFTLTGSSSEVKLGTDSGSGGFTLTGSGTEVRVYPDSKSGGFTLSGSASEIYGQGDVASGGFTLSGSADETTVLIDTDTGGFILSGTASEIRVYQDSSSGGFALAGSSTEFLVHVLVDAMSGGFFLGGSGVDDFSTVSAPPEPTPLEGLDWHLTGLWYPGAESVAYYGRIADPVDGQVRIPLNDSRTAQVTVSTFDPVLKAMIGHTYARCLRVYYHGDLIFWGPCKLNDVDSAAGTVTLSAMDPSVRLIKHFLRRGDLDGALSATNHDRATVTIDHLGLRLIRDAGKNTPGQTDRGVPDLGIADGTNHFTAAPDDLMGVARWDQCWSTMQELSASLGPDFELEPVEGTPGVYCQLNTYAVQGSDISSTVAFHYGTGLDNLENLAWTEGSKYTTHVQTLDRAQTYRITPANLATSADTGPYVDVDITDFDAHDIPEVDALRVLEAYGNDVLAAYSHPLIECKMTLPVETADSFRYLRDFIVGDIIGAAAKTGEIELPEGDYRITAVELHQEGSENATRPLLDVVSSHIPTTDSED
jgi:hypothetical protein